MQLVRREPLGVLGVEPRPGLGRVHQPPEQVRVQRPLDHGGVGSVAGAELGAHAGDDLRVERNGDFVALRCHDVQVSAKRRRPSEIDGSGGTTWTRAPAAASGSHRTHDLLPPPAQKVSGSNDYIALQTAAFPAAASSRLAAGPVSVRRNADGPADCIDEKDLQMHAFWEAAEGIRTLDLLHGKQTL